MGKAVVKFNRRVNLAFSPIDDISLVGHSHIASYHEDH